jgi:peroxiredoxin
VNRREGSAVRKKDTDEAPMSLLTAGNKAPEFSLPSTPDQKISLSDYRGITVVLVFYPADWSPVCGSQLALYNEALPMFTKQNTEMLGLSVDGVWSHQAFAKERKLRFPILSDFEPKGEVAKLFGAYRAKEGICERALFIVDGEGMIRWSYLSPLGVNPGASGILDALEELTKKEMA